MWKEASHRKKVVAELAPKPCPEERGLASMVQSSCTCGLRIWVSDVEMAGRPTMADRRTMTGATCHRTRTGSTRESLMAAASPGFGISIHGGFKMGRRLLGGFGPQRELRS